MSDNTEANKRIAKNTLLLYIRMGIMMIISFFTARITLEALGVVDYGINNVVGGLVSMFSLISSSLSSSVSRFMTFGLGQGDKKELNTIFSTSINIHIILAFIIIIAIETVGVWFLNNKMVIPAERLNAAHWILQSSTILFAVGLMSTPYNAAIIAHERMDVYTYFTFFDVLSKLVTIFAIKYYGGDKLILLAIISLIPPLIKQFYFWNYSKKHFEECTYHAVWDKRVFKEMFSFAGWNFIGCTAGLTKDQGVNIAINMFTGPAVNAARGIAMQINGIIGQFIGNFLAAINPQIIKEYAAGNLKRMHALVFKSTRFSYYLFLFLSIPVLLEVETILYIWLGQVPEHTVLFTRLVIILSLAEIISNALIRSQEATGKIRNYQIVVGGILLMNFPISYVLLRMGYFPEITVIVAIIISQICLFARLAFLKNMVKLPVRSFLKDVYCNVIIVSAIAFIAPFFCHIFIGGQYLRLFVVCIVSVITSGLTIYFIGCNKDERNLAKRYINKIKNRFLKR
ncbi:MAG: lipopolysaccharide biosynthesis protein [Bacteroidaceae bacterium]|nr:lipopolysaccharide biosynthesis protein [Bacteroidaceae bacterium]